MGRQQTDSGKLVWIGGVFSNSERINWWISGSQALLLVAIDLSNHHLPSLMRPLWRVLQEIQRLLCLLLAWGPCEPTVSGWVATEDCVV